MNNPFVSIKIKPELDLPEPGDVSRQRIAKREEIYAQFSPIVNEILDMVIDAHRQGIWERGCDWERRYCCHIAWFAGPKETHFDPYDIHHTIRRRIEIKLEMDGFCHPTGFMVTNFEAIDKIIHVGLNRDELINGIKTVMG